MNYIFVQDNRELDDGIIMVSAKSEKLARLYMQKYANYRLEEPVDRYEPCDFEFVIQ